MCTTTLISQMVFKTFQRIVLTSQCVNNFETIAYPVFALATELGESPNIYKLLTQTTAMRIVQVVLCCFFFLVSQPDPLEPSKRKGESGEYTGSTTPLYLPETSAAQSDWLMWQLSHCTGLLYHKPLTFTHHTITDLFCPPYNLLKPSPVFGPVVQIIWILTSVAEVHGVWNLATNYHGTYFLSFLQTSSFLEAPIQAGLVPDCVKQTLYFTNIYFSYATYANDWHTSAICRPIAERSQ